jgi:type II secretory pathway component PulM
MTWLTIAPTPRKRVSVDASIAHTSAIYFCLWHPHIACMANWQKSFTREAPKTKAELREMLTEAVRNTQSGADHGPKRLPKAKGAAADAACVD